MLRPLLELARVSNLPTAWTNVLAAWLLAGGSLQPVPGALGLLLLGASLLYCGGMMLNDAADAAWDTEHRPERAIPRGAVSRERVWQIGIGALLAGAACMVAAGAAWTWTACLVTAILVYDLYHKPWAGSVLVMGACRTLLYLVAASSVKPDVLGETRIVAAAVCMGLYIVGVSLTARAESQPSTSLIRRLLVRYLLVVPVVPTIGAFLALHFGRSEALPGPGWLLMPWIFFVTLVVRHMGTGKRQLGEGVGWLLAGIAGVDAVFVAQVNWQVALSMVALVPLLRLWQRWVAAT
jgi:hypothetical protein